MTNEFTDSRITIRPYRAEDTALLFEAVRETVHELSRWMPWCHSGYSLTDSASFVDSRQADWDKGEHYSFVIEDTRDRQFLGGTGLNFFNRAHNFANLGYWVRSSQTRRGVAAAAVQLAARFGFQKLKLTRLEIVMAAENSASRSVAEKVNATYEGLLRQRLVLHGRCHDALMFSLVPADLGLA